MAYDTKYQVAWYDRYNQEVYVYFKKRNYSGDITTLKASDATPPQVRYETNGDLIYWPIKGSYIQVRVIEESFGLLREIYTESAREWKVEMTVAGSTKWKGYVASEYSSAYEDINHVIEIIATDQLGYLKYIPFQDSPEFTLRSPLQMLQYILGATNLDLNMREGVNLYETRMDMTVADSPLDQCYLDQENYIEDEDTSEMKTCYDVLYDLLLKFTAVIRQVNGEWHIWRPSEAVAGNYTRRLWTWNASTELFTYTSNENHDPEVATTAANVSFSSIVRIANGARLALTKPWKNYTLSQILGLRENFLQNHNFSEWLDDNTPKNWTKGGGITTTRSQSRCIVKAQAAININDYIIQIRVVPTENADQKLRLKIKFSTFVPAATTLTVRFYVALASSYHWDFNTNTWDNTAPYKYLEITCTTSPTETVEREIFSDDIDIGIGVPTTLFVKMTQPVCSNVNAYVALEAIECQLIKVSGEYENEETELVTVNDDNLYKSSDIEFLTGDLPDALLAHNPALLLKGGMYLDTGRVNATVNWEDVGLGSSGLSDRPLLEWLKQKIGQQYDEPKQFLTARIVSNLIKPDSIIKEVNDGNKLYFIHRATQDLREGIWDCELIEMGEGLVYVVDKDSGSEEYIVMDSEGERVIE